MPIGPVPPIDAAPQQPSNPWRAVRAATPHRSPGMSARILVDHIQELPS
ncbi:hypothetical protein ACFVWP_32580 [Streptomyces sp. NPDC058175]